jgi:hypothetical protein
LGGASHADGVEKRNHSYGRACPIDLITLETTMAKFFAACRESLAVKRQKTLSGEGIRLAIDATKCPFGISSIAVASRI